MLLTGAVLLRLLSAVNRSIICTEFAGGSFLKLIARFCFVTAEAAVRSRRKTDLASIALTLAALAILAMRLRTEGFGGWVEGFLGGEDRALYPRFSMGARDKFCSHADRRRGRPEPRS